MFSLTMMVNFRETNKIELAENFSVGKFKEVFDYLDENIVWTIIGETEFRGKQAVVSHCKQVKEYFNSVTTRFEIQDTMSDYNKVVVMGTAAFNKDNQVLSTISACDVYEFNSEQRIIKITSYCIKH